MNRKAEKAGTWYPAGGTDLRSRLDDYLSLAHYAFNKDGEEDPGLHTAAVVVPHAGLSFSGAIAARAYAFLKNNRPAPETILIFGAAHRGTGHADGLGAVWPEGCWESPLGNVRVDAELAAALVDAGVARADPRPHLGDNAIELQIPFMAYMFPGARIVPVATPPSMDAVRLGRAAHAAAARLGRRTVAAGSTDLTHYGASFDLMPAGRGSAAVEWTRENSEPFLRALLDRRWDGALTAAARDHSACGAGAAVAAGAFAEADGATASTLLEHETSAEITGETASADHIVDYAALAFTRRLDGKSGTDIGCLSKPTLS